MSVKAKHPDPRVEALVSDARNSGTDETIIQQHLVPYFEKTVRENGPTVEEQVREDLGLSREPHKEPERGPAERLVRQELEHPSLPTNPNDYAIPDRIPIETFRQKYPDYGWVIDDALACNESRESIEHELPVWVQKIIPEAVQERVWKEMHPRQPYHPPPAPPSTPEEKYRKTLGLPRVDRQ